MDYSKFDVEDFAGDEYFLRWVNEKDPEAERFWNFFISLHPEIKPKIEKARVLVLDVKASQKTEFPEADVDMLWTGIQKRINEPDDSYPVISFEDDQRKTKKERGTHTSTDSTKQRTVSPWWRYRVAASLILMASIGGALRSYYVVFKEQSPLYSYESAGEEFIEEVNNTTNSVRIHLSEGSVINLARESRVRYKKDFGGEEARHVFLAGEAFFEVARNPDQPFFVHAGEVVTKVLGTSFRVSAYSDVDNITVAVSTGKVSVSSEKEPDSKTQKAVILLPNQQVVYQRKSNSFDKSLVESPVLISPPAVRDFNFENAFIGDAFKVLEKAYGIEIIYDKEVMSNCFITAPLGSESLFEKLRIICRTIGASYEIIDTRVVISSSGC